MPPVQERGVYIQQQQLPTVHDGLSQTPRQVRWYVGRVGKWFDPRTNQPYRRTGSRGRLYLVQGPQNVCACHTNCTPGKGKRHRVLDEMKGNDRSGATASCYTVRQLPRRWVRSGSEQKTKPGLGQGCPLPPDALDYAAPMMLEDAASAPGLLRRK